MWKTFLRKVYKTQLEINWVGQRNLARMTSDFWLGGATQPAANGSKSSHDGGADERPLWFSLGSSHLALGTSQGLIPFQMLEDSHNISSFLPGYWLEPLHSHSPLVSSFPMGSERTSDQWGGSVLLNPTPREDGLC